MRRIRVGIILFDHRVHVVVNLNTDRNFVKGKLRSKLFEDYSGGTVFSLALREAHNMFKNKGRVGVKKIMIFQTDGHPDTNDNWMPFSNALKNDNVTVYVVGVTKYVNAKQLNHIASHPRNKFSASSYSKVELKNVCQSLANEIKAC